MTDDPLSPLPVPPLLTFGSTILVLTLLEGYATDSQYALTALEKEL